MIYQPVNGALCMFTANPIEIKQEFMILLQSITE
jgi:hypothetical protein